MEHGSPEAVDLGGIGDTLGEDEEDLTLDGGPEAVEDEASGLSVMVPVKEGDISADAMCRLTDPVITNNGDDGTYPVDSFLAVAGSMPHFLNTSLKNGKISGCVCPSVISSTVLMVGGIV